MARDPKKDWYWPLGELEYQHEIRDFFPEEAEMIGVITILWNRQELKLRHIYRKLIASKRPAYAEAIWDRQPTHQAKRDLLALAIHTAKLTKRQAAILEFIIEKTKVMADRRNELLHAEYVVHGRTDKLHAKVKTPRSNKPPKHQKVSASDLQKVIDQLEWLLQATDTAWFEFETRRDKKLTAQLRKFAEERGLSRENRQSDSDLPSLRQTHGEEF
jgi:hypothetical protein